MSKELEPLAASNVKSLNYLKSYDMYPPATRPYIEVNMMTGIAKFYKNGVEKEPTEKDLAQYTWDLTNALAHCERKVEALMRIVNEAIQEKHLPAEYLEDYLEEYPETEISKHEVDLADLELEILIGMIKNKPINNMQRVHKLRDIIGKAKGVQS